MTEAITLTAAYLLDLAIGDPKWLPHPVRGIGWVIEKMEQVLRKSVGATLSGDPFREVSRSDPQRRPVSGSQKSEELAEKISGILLVIGVVSGTYAVFYFINQLLLASHFSLLTSYLTIIILAILIATTIATRELIKSAQTVIDEVRTGDVERARGKLAMIVGRDTHSLDRKGILKATIETLSENASDGIVAPLFYFALGGLPLAMAYKAVNTLDSMVGYKNETYRNFGWAAARLDDIANYIPARITGLLIVVASFILVMRSQGAEGRGKKTGDALSSLKTMLRDGRKHSSPNSGVPEAAMAGALGVRLGGPSMYGGVLVEKPFIGEEESEVSLDRLVPSSQSERPSAETRIGKSVVRERIYEDVYLEASEDAISLVKITSLLGFGLALLLIYVRSGI